MHATDSRLTRFASIKDESRRTYAAMLTALDEGVGKVLETVRAAGLEQDTLVVFLSDNGGPTMLGTTINGSRNDPFRGSKRTTLEGGIRVPVRAAAGRASCRREPSIDQSGDPARPPADAPGRGRGQAGQPAVSSTASTSCPT